MIQSNKSSLCSARVKLLAFSVILLISLLFPLFLIQPATASGSPDNPIEISDWNDLNAVRDDLSAHYVLVNDLDETTAGYDDVAAPTANDGAGWEPIGTLDPLNFFTGTLDGQGYVIKNLFIDRPDSGFVGLFGIVDIDGVVEDLGMENVDVTGGNNYTGGLIGANAGGTVSNSYSTGSVTGDNIVGGLVGGNGGGTISNSYSTVEVSARLNAGGLIGRQDNGTVSNSYSTGDVTRTSGDKTNFGSFAGELDYKPGTIEYSYSTGSVYYDGDPDPEDKGFVGGELGDTPTYTSNFFDSEVSNQSEGIGAEAKTTEEMKDFNTFTAWDIVRIEQKEEEYKNPDYIWNIVDGQTYPFLSWEILPFEEEPVPPPDEPEEDVLPWTLIGIGLIIVIALIIGVLLGMRKLGSE